MAHGLCGWLWLPCVLFAIPVHYKLPEVKTQPLGLVLSPEQSMCLDLQTYWARPTSINLSVNGLVKLPSTLLLTENTRKHSASTQGCGVLSRICFYLGEYPCHMVCVDSQYWRGLMEQTSDGHCPESDGAFGEESLLSIGMGGRCSSGPV